MNRKHRAERRSTILPARRRSNAARAIAQARKERGELPGFIRKKRWTTAKEAMEHIAPGSTAAKKRRHTPRNVLYHSDLAHLCEKYGFWHLSRFEWLYGPLPETPDQVMW